MDELTNTRSSHWAIEGRLGDFLCSSCGGIGPFTWNQVFKGAKRDCRICCGEKREIEYARKLKEYQQELRQQRNHRGPSNHSVRNGYGYGGYNQDSDYDVVEMLAQQGIHPWDDDAAAALAVLYD